MQAGGEEELSYRAKAVRFGGRECVVLLQDVNGPCPLLAIANVLLLQDKLRLPPGVGEVSEARLVQLVAGYLLDATSLEGRDVSEEYRLNLQHNVADAIETVLPKLTTGVDVNLRFHDIGGFEFTKDTSIFDLLNIPLVHGWLCDPQDEPTCCALGQKTYNELVMQLVSTLGSAATPPHGATPTGSFRQTAGGSGGGSSGGGAPVALAAAFNAAAAVGTPAAAKGGAGTSLQGALPTIQEGAASRPQPIDADTLAAALQSSLAVSQQGESSAVAPQPAPAAAASAAAASTPPPPHPPTPGSGESLGTPGSGSGPPKLAALRSQTNSSGLAMTDSMKVLIDDMMAGLVQEAFAQTPDKQPTPSPRPQPPPAEAAPAAASAAAPHGEAAAEEAAASRGKGAVALVLWWPAGEDGPVQVELQPQELRPGAGPTLSTASPVAAAPAGTPAAAPPTPPDEGAVHDALLVQHFLEATPSQLTWHGLQALHDGLKENQLAIFFRNNHFNTMLKHEGGLYILVTDQGYQFESDVVWEHLATVDGDTQFVDCKFRPFVAHAPAPAVAGGQAPAAEFESGGAAGGGGHEDADFALALQLQQEEHERAEQRAQRAAAAQQTQQQPAQQGAGQAGAARRAGAAAPAAGRPAQQQAPPAAAAQQRSESGSGLKKFKKKMSKATDDCSIM